MLLALLGGGWGYNVQEKRYVAIEWPLLSAICGSARSMDRAAQSMDPYFGQESMDWAG